MTSPRNEQPLAELDLKALQLRPQMFLLDGSYHDYVAFLSGADTVTRGELLRGFSGWLADRLGKGHNLAWPILVIACAYPAVAFRDLPDVDSLELRSPVIECLFSLLSEFWHGEQETPS